jgi:catechol 2,3-dioxygenase-like lactoylglutathione lyase family enzyme
MSIELNHTIVHVKDRWAASRDVGQVLGLPEATAYGPFAELKLDNGASLDFMDTEGEIPGQHYAFLVSEEDFDGIFARIQAEGIPYWADPGRSRPQQINHNDGGRGVYFADPDGHFLEAITRPYGSGAA